MKNCSSTHAHHGFSSTHSATRAHSGSLLVQEAFVLSFVFIAFKWVSNSSAWNRRRQGTPFELLKSPLHHLSLCCTHRQWHLSILQVLIASSWCNRVRQFCRLINSTRAQDNKTFHPHFMPPHTRRRWVYDVDELSLLSHVCFICTYRELWSTLMR